MNSVEAAEKHLLRFCQNKDQRVYAFKGPWGVGKSYLVRKLTKENHADLPSHPSYVSVFGLSTIGEVQERVSGCMEQHRSILGRTVARAGGKVMTTVLSAASGAKASLPYVPLQLPNFAAAAFWHIAKKSAHRV